MFLYNGRYGVVTDQNGLYYMRARYYNTDIKRFINQDVVEGNITNSPSLNRYAYCQGNPVSLLDPFGLSPQISWSAIGHGVLDVLGMIPGVGVVADIANAFWYISEGDYFSAASSFVSAIPGIGDIAGGIAKGITGCTKISKAIKFATRFASNIGNFALGAYSTATQIYGLWDKYVIKGQPWGEESLGEFFGAAFTGVSTVLSGKSVVDDIVNYKNIKHDILTSQCFVEGTLIVTADGDKPIEEIQAGDLVHSTNPETGESEYKEVLRTFRKESDVLIHIFINGEEIQTTPVHPFWVVDEWVSVKDLEVGDVLTLADGTTAPITQTYGEKLDAPVIVYNFEVAEFHTYYVTDTGVLVHNQAEYISESGDKSSKDTGRVPNRDKVHLEDGNLKEGWIHIDARHITGDHPDGPGDLFEPHTTRTQIEKAANIVISKGKRISNLGRRIQTFEKKIVVNGRKDLIRLIVDSGDFNRVITIFPVRGEVNLIDPN